MEFGTSCMGHEIPAALGIRMARSESGEIYPVVGDGTYLMANSELATAVQENLKVTVVLLNNHGYQCIRALQLDTTGQAFGNEFRKRTSRGLTGDYIPIDFAAHAASLGCTTFAASTLESFEAAVDKARTLAGPVVIVCDVDPDRVLIGSDAWWDLGIAEASADPDVTDISNVHRRKAAALQRYYS
jgi:3D-(3,5/4)-trihydroxycyclohexane-1,2-dione acylhydrolase (decyclizing)